MLAPLARSHLLQMRGLKHNSRGVIIGTFMSHLLQMRGLKPKLGSLTDGKIQVASFTDAWIETCQSAGVFSQCRSHLLQMRGLKLTEQRILKWLWMSHLLQMRGLKQYISVSYKVIVSSHLLQMRGLKP